MLLSDITIKKYLERGSIQVIPNVISSDIRPVGIRVHLSEKILVPLRGQVIDPTGSDDIMYDEYVLTNEGYRLEPNEFVLGSTREIIKLDDNILALLDGRSTMARIGMAIHCSSFFIDGIHDQPRSIVLEIKNFSPYTIILRPYMAIGMLSFILLTDRINQAAQMQYSGQIGVMAPNLKNQYK